MKYALSAVIALIATAVIMSSAGGGVGDINPVSAQGATPPPPGLALGNPTNLTAAPGGAGEVNIGFSPALGATVHWVWRVKHDNTGGGWVAGEADGQQTVTGLTPGAGYYFIVIGGRPQTDGAMKWSQWSNWAAALAGAAGATAGGGPTQRFPANAVNGDYDSDNDGLIEVRNLLQLDAIRYDLDGVGSVAARDNAAYTQAFPGAAAGMGCPDSGCKGYELAANLDFGTDADIWAPIGNGTTPFAATFEGNGYTISNLQIDWPDNNYVGFFGMSSSGSVIRGVGLLDATVSGNYYVGGLVGYNRGAINDSYATGAVSGSGGAVGGLVGQLSGGAIRGSHAAASVNGTVNAGGLVGVMISSATIHASYATGDVRGRAHAGGLVGYSTGAITASYATGDVSSYGWNGSSWAGEGWHGDVGGLVGHNSGGSIANSYATGDVYSNDGWCSSIASGGQCWGSSYYNDDAGGLVGENSGGAITNSYATGAVSALEKTNLGGLVGTNSGAVTGSYWDLQTSGLGSSAAGTGRTTAQLQRPTRATGNYADWDSTIWDFGTAQQYPALKVDGLSVAAQRE